MAYAARHSEHVAGLVLVDSAGPKWDEKSDVEDKIYPDVVEKMKSIEFAADFGDKAARDEYSREDFSMLYYSPEKRENVIGEIQLGSKMMPDRKIWSASI